MTLTDGPLQSFKGVWQFHPIRTRTTDGSLGELRGCKVELTVEFAFRNAALDLFCSVRFSKRHGTRSWTPS
jgi:ribosome-associated toxin RatA of RatAB toxin-antitoxin module